MGVSNKTSDKMQIRQSRMVCIQYNGPWERVVAQVLASNAEYVHCAVVASLIGCNLGNARVNVMMRLIPLGREMIQTFH